MSWIPGNSKQCSAKVPLTLSFPFQCTALISLTIVKHNHTRMALLALTAIEPLLWKPKPIASMTENTCSHDQKSSMSSASRSHTKCNCYMARKTTTVTSWGLWTKSYWSMYQLNRCPYDRILMAIFGYFSSIILTATELTTYRGGQMCPYIVVILNVCKIYAKLQTISQLAW